MKTKKYIDNKKRNLNLRYENKRYVLKSLFKNVKITKQNRWNFNLNLSNINCNSTSLVKRCVLTGQKKKINKFFNLSRLSFLRLARNGLIHGIRKSTW